MNRARRARERLLARARQELPEPGDPGRLLEDLAQADLGGPEVLQVLARTGPAWQRLRDLKLERAWQRGWGWFLARNVVLFAFLALLLALALRVPQLVLQAVLAGAGALYLLTMALGPLRLRRQRRARAAILQAYAADLGGYLDELEQDRLNPPAPHPEAAHRTPG